MDINKLREDGEREGHKPWPSILEVLEEIGTRLSALEDSAAPKKTAHVPHDSGQPQKAGKLG